jgi:hypothetical protein
MPQGRHRHKEQIGALASQPYQKRRRGMAWKRRRSIPLRAFSSEVDTGSREENASKQKSRAPIRFNRIGEDSEGQIIGSWLTKL